MSMIRGGDVLVVLDGRAQSERVVGWVGRLCRGKRVSVRLLMVRRPERGVWAGERVVAFASQLEDAVRLESLAYLHGIAARLEERGIRATPEVRFGTPTETVLAAVRASGVELVALAASVQADVADAMGRLARELLRRSPIPVFVARTRGQRAA